MKAQQYIISKQLNWARNRNLQLQGSKITRGAEHYTKLLEDNLFEPLTTEVLKSFEEGDGKELYDSATDTAKMKALHSSSALAVNQFHFWNTPEKAKEIAVACRLCSVNNTSSQKIMFEKKFPISPEFKIPPNIDVVIHNKPDSQIKLYAIECKFSESYSGYDKSHKLMKEAYFAESLNGLWSEIPNLQEFAKRLSQNVPFNYLHPAQLIKHTLGLLNSGLNKNEFRLMYLWYDVLGEEGAEHREEIDEFKKIAKRDDLLFHAMTYQELILNLADNHRDKYPEYIRYMTERYL